MVPKIVVLHESPLAVFVPHGDDTFASISHAVVAVVSTPEGEWRFCVPVELPSGNDFRSEHLQASENTNTFVIERRDGFDANSDMRERFPFS